MPSEFLVEIAHDGVDSEDVERLLERGGLRGDVVDVQEGNHAE